MPRQYANGCDCFVPFVRESVSEAGKSENLFLLRTPSFYPAPEGTRKNVTKWKTGFYHIAVKAGIPIVMAAMDYSLKTVFFSPPFYPSGNMPEDVLFMETFFKDKKGRNRGVTPILG